MVSKGDDVDDNDVDDKDDKDDNDDDEIRNHADNRNDSNFVNRH